jgi:hypothetical protein
MMTFKLLAVIAINSIVFTGGSTISRDSRDVPGVPHLRISQAIEDTARIFEIMGNATTWEEAIIGKVPN